MKIDPERGEEEYGSYKNGIKLPVVMQNFGRVPVFVVLVSSKDFLTRRNVLLLEGKE